MSAITIPELRRIAVPWESTEDQPMNIEPGFVYLGMPDGPYHRGPGVSKSGLDRVHDNPALYDLQRRHPTPDPEFAYVGKAFHCLVLEPDRFDSRYVLSEYAEYRSQEAKAWREEQVANGLQVLSMTKPGKDPVWEAGEWDTVHRMADAVRAHPMAAAILNPGDLVVESSAYWVDRFGTEYSDPTYRLCKCRPDAFNMNMKGIADLKSARDASMTKFTWAAKDLRYEVAAAWYTWGWRVNLQLPCEFFAFVVVEKTPPYTVEVYTFDTDAVKWGLEQAMSDLESYSKYMADDMWPSTTGKIRPLSYSDAMKRSRVR